MSMHKLFRANLSQTLIRNQFNTTAKTLSQFHHFHGLTETSELRTSTKEVDLPSESDSPKARSFKIPHPWPEWIDLMNHLLTGGYFSGDENPFRISELGRQASLIWKAGLKFSRDRFDVIKFLSKENIRVVAESGCPSLNGKVVISGKRLRIHVNVNEGDTCSSCSLREGCERAYVMESENLGGRSVDVMRILLVYGLDYIAGTVQNKPCLDEKVTKSVRILLRDIVACSKKSSESNLPKSERLQESGPEKDHPSSHEATRTANSASFIPQEENRHTIDVSKRGDWLCPKCNIINFPGKIKCFRCGTINEQKLRLIELDFEDIPLKKGDWKCEKCKFQNFAKNSVCLMCEERPLNRTVNPWEWECPSCNWVNSKRTKECYKCDYKWVKKYRYAQISSRIQLESDFNKQTNARRRNEQCFNDSGEKGRSDNQDDSDSFDFPIVGGKSDLSQSVQGNNSAENIMKNWSSLL